MENGSPPDIAQLVKEMRVKIQQAAEVNDRLGSSKIQFNFSNEGRAIYDADLSWIRDQLMDEFVWTRPISNHMIYFVSVSAENGATLDQEAPHQDIRLEISFSPEHG